MKKILASFLFTFFVCTSVFADGYRIDPEHTTVSFKIRHLMSYVRGQFNEFEGELVYDGDYLPGTVLIAKINAASIDTNSEKRDEHLRSEDFFNVKNYPEITFVSTSINTEGLDEGHFELTGKLRMVGIAQDVTLLVKDLGEATGERGEYRRGFLIKSDINRKNWRINSNKRFGDEYLIGDEVAIEIDLQAVREHEADK